MLVHFFFTVHSIYEFAALTNITVETEGPSEFSVSGLVFVFEPNSSSSSSFHLTVFSILLLSPLIPDICHFWYATTFDLGRGVRSDVQLSRTETRFQKCSQSGKMVLNTQCYQYLWLSMWFHAKKLKETLKNPKSLILQCKFGSRAQKWPKIAKKTDH